MRIYCRTGKPIRTTFMEIEIIRVFNNVYSKESYKKAYNRKVQIDYRIAYLL